MEFRGEIYNTLSEWNEANDLAHNVCNASDKYTSNDYANPIITTDNKYVLIELKGFESELKNAGFNFVNLNKSIIKIIEL
tara:strand:- start:2095 stop:2334 length:240 start_codon:yes stop_codon:yes gene_type:complete